MSGAEEPVAIIFPQSASDGVEVLYQEFSFGRYFNQIAAGVLRGIVQTRQPRQPLRILEVGGGTGGTTAWLLPELNGVPALEYHFTDISALFTRRAQQKFADYDFVKYSELDLEKEAQSKDKRNWLGFIQAGGSASYGIADNVASNTDVNTPLIYRYVGTEQTSWNVGGGISIPFEKLFDLRGGIKRQRIQVDIAELRKQEAYETLKIQIAHLYVQILSNIETLQRSAENIALYKGASAVAEQEYRNRRTSIHDVAKTKEQEFAANQDFALLRSTINDQLLTLEIISHTPILTIQGEKDVQETTIQEQEENKRLSKKKDKKE